MLRLRLDTKNSATVYACDIAFRRWTGWNVSFEHHDDSTVEVCSDASANETVTFTGVGDTLLPATETLLARAFAETHLQKLRADGYESLLSLFGPSDWLDEGALSALFFILSGESEALSPTRDAHGRFPATASVLHDLGLLDLPVVDVLAAYLQDRVLTAVPGLPAPSGHYEVIPSHDVDAPFKYAFKRPHELLRLMAGSLLRDRDASALFTTPRDWARVRRGEHHIDPYNCFDRMLSITEQRGLRSQYYFIAGNTAGRIDGDYQVSHPLIAGLMRSLLERGHVVGLHPSYHASTDVSTLTFERTELHRVAAAQGHCGNIDLVRTHYLRFDPAHTPAALADAGFLIDSSLGFADIAGFRRGTSRSFPLWDCSRSSVLPLIEQPLVAMECSLLTQRYEGLSHEQAAQRLTALKGECRRFGGKFTMLWHNNYLSSEEDFSLYEHAIS